jgi:imidazolonepropionase-like amidohydrolase
MLQADGVEECRKAVRLNLRRGARLIKVFTSGGIMSRDDELQYQQFSDEELKVIVEEAKRMGMICAAHAVGKAGIMAAINAGFKVIEHNSYADSEVFEAMKKNDVMLVATITPLQSILDNKDKYPPTTYEKAASVAKAHKAAYRAAVKAGVKCAIGSDLFGGIGTALSPGLNGLEVPLAVEVGGMTNLEAIQAATANGPCTVGSNAPKSGQVKEGYNADLLGLMENPSDDIDVLKNPKKIVYIWKGGRLVKAPGLDPVSEDRIEEYS